MNKNLLVVTCLLAATSVADAQPAATDAQPRAYVSAGATVGADGRIDWLYSGVAIEGGYRLSTSLWMHGQASVVGRSGYGTANHLTLIAPSADSFAGEVGPEVHHCASDGSLCVLGGVDLGYRTGKLQGLVATPRLGLDVGGKSVRFRPAIELGLGAAAATSDAPLDVGVGVTAAVAYQW